MHDCVIGDLHCMFTMYDKVVLTKSCRVNSPLIVAVRSNISADQRFSVWQEFWFILSNFSRCVRDRALGVGWLCWGLTSQSTIFQSCRDGAIASWVINQYFRGVKCLAQGHNTAAVGFEPRTSRSGVRHSTTEPPRSPRTGRVLWSRKINLQCGLSLADYMD